VGVSTYGGGIWRTWFDRDLSVAGEVVVRACTDAGKDPRDIVSEHHYNFLDVIAAAANATPEQVVDMDLYLYDANPAVRKRFCGYKRCLTLNLQRIGGIHDEFITDYALLWKNGSSEHFRNRSAIVAFAVGGAFVPGNGFSIVVGHTDSPCLRVKPVSKLQSQKFNQVGVSTYGGGIWRTWFDRDLSVGVSTYGGGIWRTWFDRDLSVAGEVVVRAGDTLARRLINVGHPILYIPNLAIHFCKDRDTFTCNKETDLIPILETVAASGINEQKKDKDNTACTDAGKDPRDIVSEHHYNFLDVIAAAANATPEQVVDMDLYLYDANPARIGGIHDEFITGARLDNLVGTYTAIQGLIASLLDERLLMDDGNIRMAACFDNEEVGSKTAMGAGSSFIEYVLRRLSAGGEPLAFEESIGKSLLISADQAHASHPNYPKIHEVCKVFIALAFTSFVKSKQFYHPQLEIFALGERR
ncbi:unnamed protein product, partial [Strongylus vulgaris]